MGGPGGLAYGGALSRSGAASVSVVGNAAAADGRANAERGAGGSGGGRKRSRAKDSGVAEAQPAPPKSLSGAKAVQRDPNSGVWFRSDEAGAKDRPRLHLTESAQGADMVLRIGALTVLDLGRPVSRWFAVARAFLLLSPVRSSPWRRDISLERALGRRASTFKPCVFVLTSAFLLVRSG